MPELKYKPVLHDHKAFLAKASERNGFTDAYEALALEYQLAGQMLKARSRAGLTQDAVAERMGTPKKRNIPPRISGQTCSITSAPKALCKCRWLQTSG